MSDLDAFLRAQLEGLRRRAQNDLDAALASMTIEQPVELQVEAALQQQGDLEPVFALAGYAAGALGQVEAVTQLLDVLHPLDGAGCQGCGYARGGDDCPMRRILAVPYSQASGYREAWRP